MGIGIKFVGIMLWLALCASSFATSALASSACDPYLRKIAGSEGPLWRPTRSNRAWMVVGDAELRDKYGAFYAMSDFHGHHDKAERILRNAGVIGAEGQWTGRNAILVVAGDLIDKGPDSGPLLRMFKKLQREAPRDGGRVIVTNGNREGRLIADTDAIKTETYWSFDEEGLDVDDVVAYLERQPIGAFVGNVLITHSGFVTRRSFRHAAEALSTNNYAHPGLASMRSILERKGWQSDPRLLGQVQRTMDELGVHTVVFGHQPKAFGKNGIVQSADGRFVKIDPGIEDHKGAMLYCPSALRFSTQGLSACQRITSKGNKKDIKIGVEE